MINKIEVVIEGHGTFSANEDFVDMMIGRHLPASPMSLRAKLAAEFGEPVENWQDVRSVSAMLVALAARAEAEMRVAYATA